MIDNSWTAFTRRAGALALAAAFFLAAAGAGRAENADARSERYEGLIESLNASSGQRARVLESIYTELRGPDGREMQQKLRDSIGRSNILIQQGVVEALAMLGDPADLPYMETFLATSRRLEVKTLAIRLLPAFRLSGSERARFNYIAFVDSYERAGGQAVLEPLRRPPLTRRGRLDQAQERIQIRIVRAIAGQFDPVGAAMPFIGDQRYGQDARETVTHYVGRALGNDPGRWARIWAAQGRDMDYARPDEVEEIRLAALDSLAYMGAEGLPEIIDAFGRLLSSGGDILRQAAFETMAVMCRCGFDSYAPLAEMRFAADDSVEAESWRTRRFDSTRRLAVFSAGRAADALPLAGEASVFGAAADCMAAALAVPPGFPDPAGQLAAVRESGLGVLERLLMMPDLSREKRASVAMALGQIGTVRAVSALDSILASSYTSPDFGPDGVRMAEAAVEALRLAAIGAQEGRNAARQSLLALLADGRQFTPSRADAPPVRLAHMVLWRLQRLARSTDSSFDAGPWRERLGW